MLSLKRVFTSTLLLLFLTGCTADINLNITDTKTNVSLEFWDEARNSILNDPITDQKILDLLAKKTGNPVDREISKNSITYRTSYSNEKNLIDLFSVRSKKNQDTDNFKIYISTPEQLETALEKVFSESKTGDLLLNTYKKSIIFNVKYSSTNKIDSVTDNTGTLYNHSRNSVYFQYNLYNVPEKVVTIKSSFDIFRFYPLLIFMLLLILYKYIIVRRNRFRSR